MAHDLVKTERLVRRIAEQMRDKTPASNLFGIAEDYASRCAAVNQRLAQCVEMVAAGRLIDAMQHATTAPDVLEMAAALSDPAIDGWREFCVKEGLTAPETIDESAKQRIDPIYEKADAYLQKLLGDYRAAQMRRDSDTSLTILRKIVKANPGDGESKASLKSMEEGMVRDELTKLKQHVATGNDAAILQSLDRLDQLSPQREPSGDAWMQALERKAELDAANALVEVERLLQQARQQVINAQTDEVHHAVATIQTLMADHGLRLSSDSAAKLEDFVSWVAAARRKAREDAEHAAVLAQLRDQMRVADDHVFRMRTIATPVLQDDHAGMRKTWKRLTELGRPVADEIQQELGRLSGRLKHEIDRRTGARMRNLLLAAAAAVITVAAVSWQGYRYWEAASLVAEMDQLEQQRSVEAMQALLTRLDGEDSSLVASFSRLASRKVSAQAWLDAHGAKLAQVEAALAELEAMVQAQFKDADVSACVDKLAQSGQRIAELPAESQQEFTGRLDKVDLAWRQHLAGAKGRMAEQLRADLDAVEKEASASLVFTRNADEILTAIAGLRQRLTDIGIKLKPAVKELEPSASDLSRFNQINERISQFSGAAEKFKALVLASCNARDFATWNLSVRGFTGSPFLQGDMRTQWTQAIDVNVGIVVQDDVLKKMLLPDNSALWDEFVNLNKGKAGTGYPADIAEGEKRVFLELKNDTNLKDIYRYTLRGRSIYSQNVLSTSESKLGEQTIITATGRIYDPQQAQTQLRFEDRLGPKAFKETSTASGSFGEMPKGGALSKESELLVGLSLETLANSTTTQFSRSLLPVIDRLISAPEINPLFKAYLHRRLGDIVSYRPAVWGLGWTSFEKDIEELKKAGAAQLTAGDWMVPIKNKQAGASLEAFYRQMGNKHYYALARVLPLVLAQLYNGGVVYAGCVLPDGSLHVEMPGDSTQVWGFDAGLKVTIFNLKDIATAKAHPFTPIYRATTEPRLLVRKACESINVDPDDKAFLAKLPVILR